jgi:mRNA-degrading endonuclease RelE of RelBE toxin-antitoxin system
MEILKTEDFIKELEKLPLEIKKSCRKQEIIFRINWLDSRLHTKRIKELKGVYSFRITRRYRVLFYFRNDDAIFFSIGHRKDIYAKK